MLRVLSLFLVLPLWGAGPPAPPRGYHAAPGGSSAGDGSEKRPWDLPTALAGGGGRIQPGDTIWLRGGTYRGAFRSTVKGSAGAPVVIRQFPGERAVIDGASSRRDTWSVVGEYSVFWGFELTNSNLQRVTASSTEEIRPNVVVNYAAHTKFINLIVHDGGVAFYTDAKYPDVEITGCIVYNNGWQEPGHGHGHALYIKNYTGPLVARDNVVFNQYGYGIHAYTNASTGKLMNITIEGNVSFNNGSLASRRSLSANILLGGDGYAAGGTIRDNMTYFSPSLVGAEANVVVGWKTLQNGDVVVEKNYFAGGSPVLQFGYWKAARVSHDTLISWGRGPLIVRRDPAAPGQIWRDNVERRSPPTTTRVVVRPNPYEAGRAHVVVFNWGKRPNVSADMSGVLAPGDRYEVRNVQDLFGPPVTSGTMAGTTITIPMDGVAAPLPIGLTSSPAPQTGPEFDTFLVTRITSP
jgi:hypothetical protein